MTTFNLADYSKSTTFEGDYVGELATEMEAGMTVPAPRNSATLAVQRLNPSKSLLRSTHARMSGWHGKTPVLDYPYSRALQAHAGGGGLQRAFQAASAPRIREVTAAAEDMQAPGWRNIGNYKGFLVQQYRSPFNQTLYRGVWGQEATPSRVNPVDTHQDIDRTADAPRVGFTRNLPGGRGIPEDVQARHRSQNITAMNLVGQRLSRVRSQWGRTGHVETYRGVRIFRGKRNIKIPDGGKITVPFFYTTQKLKGILPGAAQVEGYLAADAMNNNLSMVDGPAETETLEQMRTIIDTHPLKEGVAPALDEGPGPAAGATSVEALPGEAGTAPENTMLSDPKNRTKTIGAGLAAAALAYFFMG